MGTGDIGDSKDCDAAAADNDDGDYSSDYRCYYYYSHCYYHEIFFKTNITMITIGFFLTINDKLFSLLIVIIDITLFSFLLSMIPYYYQYYHDNQLWLSLASSVR